MTSSRFGKKKQLDAIAKKGQNILIALNCLLKAGV